MFYGLIWAIAGRETAGMHWTDLQLITFDGFPVDARSRAVASRVDMAEFLFRRAGPDLGRSRRRKSDMARPYFEDISDHSGSAPKFCETTPLSLKRSRSAAVAALWHRRQSVRMFERSHCPPPSATGRMWSASHSDLRLRSVRPHVFRNSPACRIIEFAHVAPESLRVDPAFGADAFIAIEHFLAQVAGVGTQLPFVHAWIGAKGAAASLHFGAAPAAESARFDALDLRWLNPAALLCSGRARGLSSRPGSSHRECQTSAPDCGC